MREGERRYLELLKALQEGTATVEDLLYIFDYIRDNLGYMELEKFQMEHKALIEGAHRNVLPREATVTRLPWIKIAAVACGIALAVATYHDRCDADQQTTSNKVPVAQQKGRIRSVELPDRSVVVLREDAEIYYSEFSDSDRRVSLIGEAFFDIMPNPKKPFVIYSGDFKTKVLGTSFNLKSNTADSTFDLAVSSRSGNGRKFQKTSTGWYLSNQRIRVDRSGTRLVPVSPSDPLFSWKAVELKNVTVEEVGQFVTSRYALRSRHGILGLSKKVYMKLDGSEPLVTVMELLGEMAGYNYGIGGRAVLLGKREIK